MKNPEKIYPGFINGLPEADIPYKGIKGKILQGEDHQTLFMEIEPIGKVPPHTHGAQFGIVLEGEMSLTFDGETRKYKKGDYYTIPAGVIHEADFHSKVIVIDFFQDPDRYKPL